VAFEAGRVMLQRIQQLINEKETFAFETTLSAKSHKSIIEECKTKGYKIILLFFWVSSPNLAIGRIKLRVLKGGHYIPDDIVKRRYKRGLENFFKIFIPLCDSWEFTDNTNFPPDTIASGNKSVENSIYNAEIWQQIKEYAFKK
jgi:predicted ABC-type ATPase